MEGIVEVDTNLHSSIGALEAAENRTPDVLSKSM